MELMNWCVVSPLPVRKMRIGEVDKLSEGEFDEIEMTGTRRTSLANLVVSS
jgi:hypothetical protein